MKANMDQNLRWPTYQFTPRDEEIRDHLKDLPRAEQVLRAAGATHRRTRFEAANSGNVELHWTPENEQTRQQFLAINASDYGRYSTYHLTNYPEFITIPTPRNPVTDATLQLRLPPSDDPAWHTTIAAHQNMLEHLATAPRHTTPESLTARAEFNTAVYDMLDLRKQQRALVHDTVEYIIPKLDEPPQTADETLVARYCDRIQTQINDIIKPSGYHYQATINYAGDMLPPIICYFQLGETSKTQSVITNPTPSTEELTKTMPGQITPSLLQRFQRDGKLPPGLGPENLGGQKQPRRQLVPSNRTQRQQYPVRGPHGPRHRSSPPSTSTKPINLARTTIPALSMSANSRETRPCTTAPASPGIHPCHVSDT